VEHEKMDVSDLRIFEAVARLRGMNKAASELNTVQSNVTARVRLLEENLGMQLFHRHSRGIALTAAGQRLLPYAVRVMQLLTEARRAVTDDGIPKGPLTIGSLETTAALRLSPVLSAYAAVYPDVDVTLRTGTTCELIADVREHRVEGAFVCGPVDHGELQEEIFFREELVILTAMKVPNLDAALRKDDVRIVVLRQGCSYRQFLETMLAKRGIVGLRLLEFGTLEAIYGAVSAGLGITLLPKSLIESVWRDRRVAVHELPVNESRVDTVFIHRRDALVSSALAAFLKCARPTPISLRAAE
jgi:DNA-binding transcriptional LysR family regulator